MSNSQIFKTPIPNENLFNLLDKICIKNDKYFIFNLDSFKSGVYHQYVQTFLSECRPHYFLSKRKYLERELTYKNFVTVVRQICNYNNITYTSQIKYDKSNYDINYFIYFSNDV